MNKDVKSGLALVCLGAIFGIAWLLLALATGPGGGGGVGMVGVLAVLAVAAGLAVVIKGLVAD